MTTPPSFLTAEMRERAIGTQSSPLTMEVEKGAIMKFAEAIGDSNPLWTDEVTARKSRYGGLIAPPTFLRSIRIERPELPFDLPFTRLLDGGSDWEYFQPVRVGDRITAINEMIDLQERAGRMGLMIIMTNLITYVNQFEEVVATQTNTSIRY
ncbi:MAG: dehydratase [Chloroflexi bacterium]|nr:dehydratase [Chloroflexota bacterium]